MSIGKKVYMNRLLMLGCLSFLLLVFCSGCVTRTVRGVGETSTRGLKANGNGDLIEKKTLWIWQRAFWQQ